MRVCKDLFDYLVASNLGSIPGVFRQVIGGNTDGIDALKSLPQVVKVPIFCVPFADTVVNGGRQDLVHKTRDLFLEIVAVQNQRTVLIDGFTLTVKNIIVFQHVLTLFCVT